jgi:hypothetical protein
LLARGPVLRNFADRRKSLIVIIQVYSKYLSMKTSLIIVYRFEKESGNE